MSTLATPLLEPPVAAPSERDDSAERHRQAIADEEYEAWLADTSSIEFVDGVIVEKPVGKESSESAMKIGARLTIAGEHADGWRVYDCSMGYKVYPDQPKKFRKPDVSVMRRSRLVGDAADKRQGFFFIPADLAVEVISPTDKAVAMLAKVHEYLDHGFELVWMVVPELREVHVYRRGAGGSRVLGDQDEIDGGDVLPGFKCKVADFFAR